jgi:hypothetical protein
MDLHPDGYEDPEENNWVLPSLPDPASVPDNTSSWGPFYFWHGLVNPAQARVSVAVTREITPPWRRGLGISLRRKRATQTRGLAVGIWLAGREPTLLSEPPPEKDWREVVSRANRLEEERRSEHH